MNQPELIKHRPAAAQAETAKGRPVLVHYELDLDSWN